MVHVYSYSQVAKALGTNYRMVGELVRALKIQPKPHPSNARAKGLSDDDVEALRAALTPRSRKAVATTP